ncbi:MAG: hypothetical protein U0797_19195 [Gemmataceae bacterium]
MGQRSALRWKNGQRARRQDYPAAFPQHAAALADLRSLGLPGLSPGDGRGRGRLDLALPRCATAFALTEIFPPRTLPTWAEEVPPLDAKRGTVHGRLLRPD